MIFQYTVYLDIFCIFRHKHAEIILINLEREREDKT